MNYDFAVLSDTSQELQGFLKNPTVVNNLEVLFNSPLDEKSIYMCLVRRRHEGWKRNMYFDLYLQLGGVNTYLITATRKDSGFRPKLELSIPHDLNSALPFHGKEIGVDRLSIGTIKGNLRNTNFYTYIDSNILEYIHQRQVISNNDMIIHYDMNWFSTWKPYEMKIYSTQQFNYTNPYQDSYIDPNSCILQSRLPDYDPSLKTYIMDFKNRVTIPSIKNFQIEDSRGSVVLQFGRVGKDVFTMDFKYPLSLFQAFCISLTRFYI